MEAQVEDIISLLNEFKEEVGVSKRLREKMDKIIAFLDKKSEFSVDKALMELEELNSSDLSSYHRTQLWEVASMLESLKL